jgi:hypothetical protein
MFKFIFVFEDQKYLSACIIFCFFLLINSCSNIDFMLHPVKKSNKLKLNNKYEYVFCDAESISKDSTLLIIPADTSHKKLTDTIFSISLRNSIAKSGKYSVQVDSINKYSFGYWVNNVQQNDHFKVSVWRKGGRNSCLAVKEFRNSYRAIYFQTDIPDSLDCGWERLQLDFVVTNRLVENNRLGVYVSSYDTSNTYFDDLKIEYFPN